MTSMYHEGRQSPHVISTETGCWREDCGRESARSGAVNWHGWSDRDSESGGVTPTQGGIDKLSLRAFYLLLSLQLTHVFSIKFSDLEDNYLCFHIHSGFSGKFSSISLCFHMHTRLVLATLNLLRSFLVPPKRPFVSARCPRPRRRTGNKDSGSNGGLIECFFRVPCRVVHLRGTGSLFPVAFLCHLSSVPCSLWLVPYSLFPVFCAFCTQNRVRFEFVFRSKKR